MRALYGTRLSMRTLNKFRKDLAHKLTLKNVKFEDEIEEDNKKEKVE